MCDPLREREAVKVEKLIITAALTGAEVSKTNQPNLPTTPDEIAQAAYECYQAGASIVHVHARDEHGEATQSLEVYREIFVKIRNKCNIIIQPSTGGGTWHSMEERLQPVYLCPEMATLTTGTCNFGNDVFYNSKEHIEKYAEEMSRLGIKPEFEIFERGMIANALDLLRKGQVQEPLHFDFVMGVPGAIPAEPRDLLYLVDSIPKNATWSVAGIGRFELPLAVMAIAMGGHVRVGFEDNIYYSKGVLAKSNAQLVERVAAISREFGREVATPDEAREILGLPKRSFDGAAS